MCVRKMQSMEKRSGLQLVQKPNQSVQGSGFSGQKRSFFSRHLVKSNFSDIVKRRFLHKKCYYSPKTIKTCSRNLPRPEECIIDAVDMLRPQLAVGDLGENFKTPPLEPLHIENIEMRRGNEFSATFSNILVNGPSKFIIEKLKADVNNLAFDFKLMLPRLNFTGKYALKIKILLLDIAGKGNVRGVLSNTIGNVRVRGSKVMRDGVEYVKFNRLQVKIKIGSQQISLDNLFNGDPVLGQVGNQIINDNSELFLNEIVPGLEKSLAKTFLDIANQVLETATFDDMFPDT